MQKILIIFLLFGFTYFLDTTFAADKANDGRDYQSCVAENRKTPLLTSIEIGYCGDSQGNFAGEGVGSIVCKTLDTAFSSLEEAEKLNLTVEDACCKAAPQCSSPREFLMFEDFASQVLDKINPSTRAGGEDKQCIGLFCSNVLVLAEGETNVLLGLGNGLVQSANKKIQTITATTVILGAIASEIVSKDGPTFFSMLLQSRAIFSDYNKITDLDARIHDTILELGMDGSYENKIPDDVVREINVLMQRYKAEGLFTGDTAIGQGVRNRKVMTMLMKMNSSMKSMVAYGMKGQFAYTESEENGLNRWSDNGINIQFDTGSMDTLKNKYDCARFFNTECDAGLKNFQKNMTKLGKDLKTGPSESLDIIVEASKKLVYFMLNGASKASEEDKEQYQSEINKLYQSAGLTTDTTGATEALNRRFAGVQKLKQKAKTFGKNAVSVYKEVRAEIKETKDQIIKNHEDRKKDREDRRKEFKNKKQIKKDSPQDKQIDEYADKVDELFDKADQGERPTEPSLEYKNYLADIVQDVLSNQKQDLSSVLLAGTNDITPNFDVIYESIQNVEKLIGTRDQQEDCIIKSLGESCEKQCENQKGKCYAR